METTSTRICLKKMVFTRSELRSRKSSNWTTWLIVCIEVIVLRKLLSFYHQFYVRILIAWQFKNGISIDWICKGIYLKVRCNFKYHRKFESIIIFRMSQVLYRTSISLLLLLTLVGLAMATSPRHHCRPGTIQIGSDCVECNFIEGCAVYNANGKCDIC